MTDQPALRLGSYELLLELAAGGMATVYLAKHGGAAGFERLVVIKRVHRHLLKMREFYDMFCDEARVASLIRHPNVVSVDDVVESDDELFLVQEWVEAALHGATFNLSHGTIDTAYLILGYRGSRRAYFRLSLGAQQRIASDAPQPARA